MRIRLAIFLLACANFVYGQTGILPNAVAGSPYSATYSTPPGTSFLGAYGVPPGLTVNPNGTITGTPTADGKGSIAIQFQGTGQNTVFQQYIVTILPGITAPLLVTGEVGVGYSALFTAIGTTSGPNWSTSGSLPPGLFLNSTTGIIAGTPNTPGAYQFSVQVSDVAYDYSVPTSGPPPTIVLNNTAGPYTITVVPRPTIVVPTLPNGIVNTAYPSATFNVNGGVNPYFWSLSGNLPPGLSLDSTTGTIGGTPTTPGTYSFVVQVFDRYEIGASTQQLSITVVPKLTLTSTPLPGGIVSTAYPGAMISAAGGTGTYFYSVSSGALPGGLSLSSSGAITGTPNAAGTFNFAVQVQDTTSPAQIASAPFSITINPRLTLPSTALPSGVVNSAYPGAQITATGTSGGATYTVASGALPAGLSLSSAGAISGTPTATGTFPFTVQVQDSTQQTASAGFSITIYSRLTLNSAPLPSGVVNTLYSQGAVVTALGGTGNVSYSIASGALPPGLSLSSAGSISGTPTTAGTFNFTAQAQDQSQPPQTATAPFSIVVNSQIQPSATALPNGSVTVVYPGTSLTVSGGTAPYTWTVSSGSLPPGLSLSSSGLISGTPTAAGTYPFTVQVTDSGQPQQKALESLQIIIGPPPLNVPSQTLPSGTANTPYGGAALSATGGTPPYAWSLSGGALPPGLTLNSAGGISGTPTSEGFFPFTAQVTDHQGRTATGQFQIQIGRQIHLSPGTLPQGFTGVKYPTTQFSTDAGGASTFTAAGQLPPGLSLSLDGILQGTPTQVGVYNFTVQAYGTGGSAASSYTVRINPGVTFTPGTLPTCIANNTYNYTFSASGGTPPYLWSVPTGLVPPGLSVSNAGVLSGTCSVAGTYSFTVAVTDANGAPASGIATVTVLPALTITQGTLPGGILTKAYPGFTFTASGGTQPYTFSLGSGTLPTGMTISPSGALSGTPAMGGSFLFTVKVTDAAGVTATAPFTLNVQGGPSVQAPAIPDGTVGLTYQPVTFTATGGVAPYSWASSGNLPPGIALSSTGVLSGVPMQSGTFNFSAQVTDANGLSANAPVTLRIAPAVLTITTGSLPLGTAGTPYSQKIGVSGGVGPFVWTSTGALPPGLKLNPDGSITGTPTAAGNFGFTATVTDSGPGGGSISQNFTIGVNLPALTGSSIQGLPASTGAANQPTFTMTLNNPYPLPLKGTLALSFVSSAVVPSDDPAIGFLSGGRTLSFKIPANTAGAVFSAAAAGIQTGTVAGTITITASFQTDDAAMIDVTPAPAPAQSVVVNPGPPVITGLTASTTSTGVNVVIQGYATTRQIKSAIFHFSTGDVTVDLTNSFGQWYASLTSMTFGSQFVYTQPFTVQGQLVGPVTVTLMNDRGSSTTMTAQF